MPSPLLDPALTALLQRAAIDPADGLQVIALDRLVARPFDAGMALLLLPPWGGRPDDAADTVLAGRHGHGSDPGALLRRLYPASHPVLAEAGDTTIGEVATEALAARPHLLPALEPVANPAGAFGLAWLVHRLRQPDGCPWDREQDHRTLKPFLLEETYEVYDALDGGATPELARDAALARRALCADDRQHGRLRRGDSGCGKDGAIGRLLQPVIDSVL
jgi:hypothetical protein